MTHRVKTAFLCMALLFLLKASVELTVFIHPVLTGSLSVVELKRSSMMTRLSGWMPTAIRGEGSLPDLVLSLAVRELEEDSFIFALCQDHKLRMWSLRVGLTLHHLPDSSPVIILLLSGPLCCQECKVVPPPPGASVSSGGGHVGVHASP